MDDVAIRVEHLSKRYDIGRTLTRHDTLRDHLMHSAKTLFRRNSRASKAAPFWALQDVSFEVRHGELIGIVGANGAGKSTLLKILSRITPPTAGQAEIFGRVGSLLEVGSGFHSELTGRENVYLQGVLLGMAKSEIDAKFDEIVAFAEVDQFLDTPVKRYSSGMYVRLAFAVAAHLDPEILLIDEVLAVGDATYQRRCVERMSQLTSNGKTVLFVSHNMDLIPRLCQRAILLKHGRIHSAGPASEIVEEYLGGQITDANTTDLLQKPRYGDGRARFTSLEVIDAAGRAKGTHTSGDDLLLRIGIEAFEPVPDAAIAVALHNLSGTRLITSWTREASFPVSLQPGAHIFECCLRQLRLRPGHSVTVGLWMESKGTFMDHIDVAQMVNVVDGHGTRHLSTASSQGILLCDYVWSGGPTENSPTPEQSLPSITCEP